MALTQTPKTNQVRQWAAADSDPTNLNGFKNIRSGQTMLHSVEVLAGTARMSVKIYDHNGSGLSHGTTLADFVFPAALSAGRSHYTFIDGVRFDNGLSYSQSQEDGITFTSAPDGAPTIRMKGSRV